MNVIIHAERSKRRCQKYCVLPQRYLVSIMAGLGVMFVYNIRMTLSIVIEKVIITQNNAGLKNSNVCQFNNTPFHAEPSFIGRQYVWDGESKFTMIVLFFVGLFMGHLLGGYLADKYNPKHAFSSAVVSLAIITAVIPLSLEQSGSWVVTASCMFCRGVAEGMVVPSVYSIISKWTPIRERGRLSSIPMAGTIFAVFITLVCTTRILKTTHWHYVIYYHSGVCGLWLIFWNILCYVSPSKNPWISAKEEEYLREKLDGHVFYGRKDVPWCKILRSRSVWIFTLLNAAHSWIWNSLIHDLPRYMVTILQFNVNETFFYSSFPYALMGTCTIAEGILSDFLINHGYVRRTTLRKILTTIGTMGPAILLLGASFSGCHRSIAIAMLTIAMILIMASYNAGANVVPFDLAPNYCGIIMGLANGLRYITGILEQVIAAKFITTKDSIYEWRYLFLVSMVCGLSTNIIFVIFTNAREQPWNLNYKQRSEM